MTPASSGQPASERAIRIRSASLAYGSITALDDVTIDIAEGEKIALVGESGAGKTSLLRALVGTAALDSGTAEVLGASVGNLRGRAARLHRRQVALVAQGLDLALPLRVIHNVNAGRLGHWSTLGALWSLIRPAGRAEAGQVLNQVGLGDRLWSRTDELSGGERQRVAIARAMLQAPVVLLADEPTASVDPKLANQLMSLLLGADAPPERTAIVSAHDPVLARAHADRVIGLRAGRVVLDQPADAVTDSELVTFYDHE